jgi:1,6-anhydro-N-acetylmuramate kinase
MGFYLGLMSGTSMDANDTLLQSLLDAPYFSLAPPKSTGRELFNMPWLNRVYIGTPSSYGFSRRPRLCFITLSHADHQTSQHERL